MKKSRLKEPDERTSNYIKTVKNDIGLVKTSHGYDSTIPANTKPDDQITVWFNVTGSGYTDLLELEDGNWVAETSIRVGIDDYDIMCYVFDHKPSRKDILTTWLIEGIESAVTKRSNVTKFTCWKCGRETHWLDCEGDLEAKLEAAEERYCGC